jgi:hypothetical protein
MKKYYYIFLTLLLSSVQAHSQVKMEWRPFNEGQEADFSYFLQASPDDFRAMYVSPNSKPFKETTYSIYIKNMDGDLNEISEVGIPEEAPVRLVIHGFERKSIIVGTMDPVSGSYKKENKVVFLDEHDAVQSVETFPLHGKRHSFEGIPDLIMSSDSNYIIILNSEICSPDKPSPKESPVRQCINVYDRDFKLVWNDTINLVDMFGPSNCMNIFSYDFIDGKFYMAGTHRAIPTQKKAAELKLLAWTSPGSYKTLIDKSFTDSNIEFVMTNGLNGNLYFNGIGTKTPQKSIHFMRYNLDDGTLVSKAYLLDKAFYAKYPEGAEYFAQYFSLPFQVITMPDGILYLSEYRLSETYSGKSGTSTTYYTKAIYMIRYNNNGEIAWIRPIIKGTSDRTHYRELFAKAFAEGENVRLFYSDYEENVNAEKAKIKEYHLGGQGSLCTVMAVIAPDGTMTKTIINDEGVTGILPYLPRTFLLDEGRYFFYGISTSSRVSGDQATFVYFD